jgi:hypothetical protein
VRITSFEATAASDGGLEAAVVVVLFAAAGTRSFVPISRKPRRSRPFARASPETEVP